MTKNMHYKTGISASDDAAAAANRNRALLKAKGLEAPAPLVNDFEPACDNVPKTRIRVSADSSLPNSENISAANLRYLEANG